MTRRVPFRGAALALLIAAGAAEAESYDVIELGITFDRETCMRKAANVLDRYVDVYGGGNVSRSNWVVYGWDLRPGDQGVVIMCPIVADTVDAFLVVHSQGSDSDRETTLEGVRAMWTKK